MGNIFWRIIVAVLGVLFAFLLVPKLANIFGVPMTGDVWDVIKICIGAIAVFYVIGGSWPPAWWRRA